MAADLAEFKALSKRLGTYRPCSVKAALNEATGEDRENLLAALEAPRTEIPAGAIEKWGERHGYEIARAGVTAHRDGKCQCAREARNG